MGKKKTPAKEHNDGETGFQTLGLQQAPFLIPKSTFETIIQKILCTPPADRNIFMSMNVYDLHEINPTLKYVPNAPTSIIIFCIRLIRSEKFHPIGATQIYDDTDQSASIADCIKVFINDLAILGLNVLATVSPTNTVFKAVLRHLVKSPKKTESKAITYSAGPFKEILHIYDIKLLVFQFESLFERHKEVKFSFRKDQTVSASWCDIYVIHTTINLQYGNAKYVPIHYRSDVSTFSPEFLIHFNKCKGMGMLTPISDNAQCLIILVHAFITLIDNTEITVDELQSICATWDRFNVHLLLKSLVFKKLNSSLPEETSFAIEAARIASILDFIRNYDVLRKNNENTINIKKPIIVRNVKTDKSNEEEIITDNQSKKPTVVNEVERENTPTVSKDICDNVINSYETNRPASTRANVLLDYLHSNNYKSNTKTDSDNGKNTTKTPQYFNKVSDNSILNNKKVDNFKLPPLKDCDIASKITETEDHNIDTYLRDSPVKLTDPPADNACSNVDFEVRNINKISNKSPMASTSSKNNCDTPSAGDTLGKDSYLKLKSMNELTISSSDEKENVDPNCITTNVLPNVKSEEKENVDPNCGTTNVLPNVKSEEKKNVDPNCVTLPNVQSEDVQEGFERCELMDEWLSTVYGIQMLADKLNKQNVRYICPFSLTTEHADYYVSLIKKAKNMLKNVIYNGRIYTFLDYECAFRTLQCDVGLYLIKK